MKNPQDSLSAMHQTIDQLYESYRDQISSPALTQAVVGYLKELKAERTPDGTVVLKTPVSPDQQLVSAWGEIANRGLSYLGLEVDVKQIRRAHSDVMRDLFQQASRDDLASLVSPPLSQHDHIQFTIRPQDIEMLGKNLPEDHRRPLAESLFRGLQASSGLPQRPAAVPGPQRQAF